MRSVIEQVAVGDQSSTRIVYAVVAALALIGVALIVLATWLVRQTRPDPELLAPLELMDDKRWRRRDPAQRRRELDDVRPEGARPVDPEKSPPDLDEDFGQRRPALTSLDDLRDDAEPEPEPQPEPGPETEPDDADER